ncbi:MAG: hypothetical protein KAJ19_19075, partial [Gammaproteobacteria bacterium]|nr:hypothetical protein [Gammaproteobacteria bacterium]
FARYAATPTASNQLSSAAWVAAWSSSANIDHIWHDDSGNIWHFCSDTTFKATANSTVRAATFNEGGTSLSAKYLGISAQAANSALLGGAAASEAASNSTIVKRTSAGYIYAGYFNMTAGDVSSGITKLACEVGTDSFLRWGTLAGVVTFLAGSFLGLTAKAADSNLLDNVNSSQFLRSDAADIVTAGGITFNDNIFLNIGTGADLEFWNNGSNSYIDINNGQNLYMRDGNSSNATRFTFDIDTGNLTATTFTGTATAAKYS